MGQACGLGVSSLTWQLCSEPLPCLDPGPRLLAKPATGRQRRSLPSQSFSFRDRWRIGRGKLVGIRTGVVEAGASIYGSNWNGNSARTFLPHSGTRHLNVGGPHRRATSQKSRWNTPPKPPSHTWASRPASFPLTSTCLQCRTVHYSSFGSCLPCRLLQSQHWETLLLWYLPRVSSSPTISGKPST